MANNNNNNVDDERAAAAAALVDDGRPNAFFEVSFNLPAAQIEITREGNPNVGPLLDHTAPATPTLSLEHFWFVCRTGFAAFLVLSGILMLVAVGLEMTKTTPLCMLPLRAWLLTQAIAQLVAVPLSLLTRRLLMAGGRDRPRGWLELSLGICSRLLNLFLFAWLIVGLVWLVSSFGHSGRCRADLPFTWTSMAVVLVVECFALVFSTAGLACSCIVVLARMLIMSHGGPMPERVRRGASAEEIQEHSELLPYRADDFPDPDDAKCVVCLGEYEEGDYLRRLSCGHQYHVECVDEWLKRNNTCPLCVRNLGAAPAGNQMAPDETETTEDFEDGF